MFLLELECPGLFKLHFLVQMNTTVFFMHYDTMSY